MGTILILGGGGRGKRKEGKRKGLCEVLSTSPSLSLKL